MSLEIQREEGCVEYTLCILNRGFPGWLLLPRSTVAAESSHVAFAEPSVSE